MKAITILVTALGGEGGGVLAEWLVETATRAGHSVQSTSIPGVGLVKLDKAGAVALQEAAGEIAFDILDRLGQIHPSVER